MMILNKEEALLLIDDLAAMAATDEQAYLFDSIAERGAFLMGVAHLKSEFVKRIDDYV